jgi:2-dehydro-3-deoxygluconokinase
MPEVIGIGEAMVLLLAQQAGPMREASSFTRHVAGAESNVAVGVSRLGHSAGFLSRVGDDEFGAAIRFRLRGEGVDVAHLITDPEAPTGLVFRERREAGPVDVVYYRKGSAASRLSPRDLNADYLQQARYVVLSGITPALSASCKETVFAVIEIARAAHVQVVFDPNMRLKLWSADEARLVLRDLAARADIVAPGADEAELITGESDPLRATQALALLGPGLVLTKLGSRGAIALSGEELIEVPAIPLARVIDPVGAGDAFLAGFLAAQLDGLDLRSSVALANRCGAHAMTIPADQECLPFRRDITTSAPASDVLR